MLGLLLPKTAGVTVPSSSLTLDWVKPETSLSMDEERPLVVVAALVGC